MPLLLCSAEQVRLAGSVAYVNNAAGVLCVLCVWHSQSLLSILLHVPLPSVSKTYLQSPCPGNPLCSAAPLPVHCPPPANLLIFAELY